MSRGVGSWLALLTASAALSCAEPARPPAERPHSSAGVSATPTSTSTTPYVDAELAFIASVRELPVRTALPVQIVPREVLLNAAEQQIDVDAPANVLEARAQFLVRLGLAPRGFDFRVAILRQLSSSLVGLYDPVRRRVLVADDIDAEETAMTRFHELAHGLVDQHFDLRSRFGYRPDGADESAALGALAEGDANAVMLEATARTLNIPVAELEAHFLAKLAEAPSAPVVPKVVWRMLTAPYSDGLKFVQALRSRGGWSAVNATWRQPPLTSAEVLHPERYPAPKPAERLPLPLAPHSDCSLLYSEVLGEQALRDLFATSDSERASIAGAWRADRLATFQCHDGVWTILEVQHELTVAGLNLRALIAKTSSTAQCAQRPPVSAALAEVTFGSRLTLAPCPDGAAPTCSDCQGGEEDPLR